jgi:phosphomannomutase
MPKTHLLKVSISGVRGVIGETLTPELICRFAEAFGAYVGRGPVIVGRDTRPSGPMVQQAVHAGLLAVGCKIVDIGVVPTPTLLIKVDEYKAVGGIAITASHNPNQWNALKFVGSDAIFLNATQANEVLDIYNQGDIRYVANADLRRIVCHIDAFDLHLARLVQFLDVDAIRRANLSVAFDCCNGAASLYTQRFLEHLGCTCHPLNTTPDGIFPHPPEPAPENIGQICGHVKETGADIGFVQDPDADRLAIVDETGTSLGEDYTLVLCTDYLLKKVPNGNAVVANLAISRAFDDVARAANAEVIHTRIGEINVTESILSNNAVIGGESNGGVIVPAVHPCRDSFTAMGILLEAIAAGKLKLSALVADLPAYHAVKRKYLLSSSDSWRLMRLLRRYDWGYDTCIRTIDGIRIDWPDKWVLIRPSNTEPVIRLVTEATTLSAAQKLNDSVRKLCLSLLEKE